jgi:hypothetical protein
VAEAAHIVEALARLRQGHGPTPDQQDDAELDRRHCPVLAGGGFEFFKFIAARDAEPCRIGGRVQLFG